MPLSLRFDTIEVTICSDREVVGTDTLEFLERVWADRKGWVDIPSKIRGHWIPWPLAWPDPTMVTRRVASALADDEDIYFSPALYRNKGRRYEDVLPTYWLWADLDKVEPAFASECGLTPTIAWASSPGRYQALWELDHPCSPEGIEKLNRAITYALGADKSGWDLTQVLRLPGTRNFKYKGGPTVEVCLVTDEIYNPKKLARRLRKTRPVARAVKKRWDRIDSRPTADGTPLAGPPEIPPQAKRLLMVSEDQVVVGERSAQLWKLECLLLEAGFTESQVYDMVVDSAWNKHKEVQTGDRQLRREVSKAARHVASRMGPTLRAVPEGGPVPTPADVPERLTPQAVRGGNEVATSPFVAYGNFLSANLEAPRWLIEELWTAKSHGIIGGEPKSMKSILSLAAAVSVASGKPWLMDKRFGVPRSGRGTVLVVQEENDPWVMQDRLRKIAKGYGLLHESEVEVEPAEAGAVAQRSARVLFPKDIPLKFLNNYGFDMTNEDHRELLEEEIRGCDPVLVVLDPLYLMVGAADVEKAVQIAPFFKWLIHLRYTYGTAIMVLHHFRKQQHGGPQVRPGQRVLGSATFHGWVESASYVERVESDELKSDEARVKIQREHRNVGPRKPLDVWLRLGDPGDLTFEARIATYDLTGQLETLIATDPGITAAKVAEILEVDRRTVLSRARGSERIEVVGTKRGHGHSYKLYLNGDGGEA